MTIFEWVVIGLLVLILIVVYAALQEIINRQGKANEELGSLGVSAGSRGITRVGK